MTRHKIYFAILNAVKNGKLKEPFGSQAFRIACPGFAEKTYTVFLSKHAEKNSGGNSELFLRVERGLYKLLRPLKYIDKIKSSASFDN